MIKVIYFDAGGVLHVPNTAVGDDLQTELNLTDEQVAVVFRTYVPRIGTGKMTEQAAWDDMHKKFGIRHVSENERLFARSFEATLQKMPGMYELVTELRNSGIKAGLLTNVTPQFAEVLRMHGHYDPFDYRVLSYEVGLWKPDPAIYQLALRLADAKPEEAVFIDDFAQNTAAAEQLGWHSILFQNTDQITKELWPLIERARP
jgi:epoxide hydrolase-like predicted phosphatase